MFPKPAGTCITSQHSLQKFICCWLGSQVRAFERSFYLPTQQCNMNSPASAPTEKLERAGLREKCASTHLCHQSRGLLWDLMFLNWSWVSRACTGKTKASRDRVEAAWHKLWRDCSCRKLVCVPKRQDPCLEEKEQWATPSLRTLSWSYSSFFTVGQEPVQRAQPLQGCMVAAWVVRLYVSMGLALLVVFEGKAHHCC